MTFSITQGKGRKAYLLFNEKLLSDLKWSTSQTQSSIDIANSSAYKSTQDQPSRDGTRHATQKINPGAKVRDVQDSDKSLFDAGIHIDSQVTKVSSSILTSETLPVH